MVVQECYSLASSPLISPLLGVKTHFSGVGLWDAGPAYFSFDADRCGLPHQSTEFVTGEWSNFTGLRGAWSSPLSVWAHSIGSMVSSQAPFRVVPLDHWSQTQFLEGHTSAQFSSNPNQTHLIQLITVFRITRNFQAGVSWSWLELNCAELWPSRNCVWDHCPRQYLYSGRMFLSAHFYQDLDMAPGSRFLSVGTSHGCYLVYLWAIYISA